MSETRLKSSIITLGGHQIHWLDRAASIPGNEQGLHPDEAAKAAVIKSPARRSEFERSRRLLRQLTGWTQPFLPDPSNRPAWPDGLCGSISHKNGHVAATTALTSVYSTVGLDCEHANKDLSHLVDKVCTDREKKMLASLTLRNSNATFGSLVALIFCAKEALFKCHYPLGCKMFWFHDAECEHFDLETGRMSLKVLIDTSPRTPAGFATPVSFARQSASDSDYWLAVCCLPASSAATASATTGTT